MSTPTIQWYPGHIAKAEQALNKNLEKVDLVIEVRDARIPISTSHPHLGNWIKGKQHLLVINRLDMIDKNAFRAWDKYFRHEGLSPFWCNAKDGVGIKQLQQAAVRSGDNLNARRRSRGMRNRAIRALTLGFPNVGKSALINRLMRKKVVDSSRKAGVTRSLRWVRLGQDLDLLDAPGVLPPRLDNQEAALKLAICDDIGQGAYDVELVAIDFLKMLEKLELAQKVDSPFSFLEQRYGLSVGTGKMNANQWLERLAQLQTSGDTRRMAQRVLDDFRKVLLGKICLELP